MRLSTEGGLSLIMSPEIIREIDRLCSLVDNMETGGVLLGVYKGASAIVTEVLPPPKDSEGGRTWFIRGIDGMNEILQKRWDQKPRTYYIGEWHFHPSDDMSPSQIDLDYLTEVRNSPAYKCPEPIMVIAGDTGGASRAFRAYIHSGPRVEEFKQMVTVKA